MQGNRAGERKHSLAWGIFAEVAVVADEDWYEGDAAGDGTRPALPRSEDGRGWQDLADWASMAWRAGDADAAGRAFFDLQARSTSWLLALAYHRGPPGEAEELVARTFIALLEHIEAGRPIHNVKGLLGTILRRRIADAFRAGPQVELAEAGDDFWERHAALTPDEDAGPGEEIAAREAVGLLANAILDTLPPLERSVLIARYLRELSVRETAARLGITEDQVKKRSQSAIALARRIAREQELCDDLD